MKDNHTKYDIIIIIIDIIIINKKRENKKEKKKNHDLEAAHESHDSILFNVKYLQHCGEEQYTFA